MIMAKSLLGLILDSIYDEEWKGKRGEKLTQKKLNLVKLLGRDGKILRNVYIPKNNGETSEIDLLFITQKGIFVFESKNYSGWIFGNEKDQKWTMVLPNGEKYQFYNPIKQNKTHIKWLGNLIGPNIPLFSIIVFSERCTLKDITVLSDDVKVIKREKTYKTVRSIYDDHDDILDEGQIEELYQKLKKFTNIDKATRIAHIENIEKKYNASDDSVCPKCGGKLVLRTAKSGANSGDKFYGCSNYPKCKYIKNISE